MHVLVSIVVSAILTSSVALSPISVADDPSVSTELSPAVTHVQDKVTQDSDQALAADLEAVRKSRGWTTEQVAAYESSEAALDSVTTLLSTEYADVFVGSALADDPMDPPSVYVKGPAPDPVDALAKELGVVLIDEQSYSLAELDALLGTVHEAALSAGFEEVVTSADIERGGAITLVVRQTSSGSLDALRRSLPPEASLITTVTLTGDSIVEDHGAFGGMSLQDGGAFLCTSGWTVQRVANGVRGVTGAGHCENIDGINHPGVGIHAAVEQQRHVGEWGDVGWYTTAQAEADDFYADQNNNIRDVTGVEPRANIAIGEGICFFGRASNNRNCTLEVENPNVFCGIGPQKLAQMNGDVTDPGDSGGGWSFGGTAYGGHKGNCFSKSSFSVADLFDEALGVRVSVN